MLGRSIERLCHNTTFPQFAGTVGFLLMHILLVLMTASLGWAWSAVFWAIAIVGSATRLDARLVHENGLDGASNIEVYVVIGGACAQIVAFVFALLAM